MAPFSSNVITSERRTRAFSPCTDVETTPLKRGGLRANWSEYPRFIIPITHSDTPGMACQVSARVARGLDKLEWPAARRQGTREGRKRKIALFLRMFVFYFLIKKILRLAASES